MKKAFRLFWVIWVFAITSMFLLIGCLEDEGLPPTYVGTVIDVEYILGETKSPKISEREIGY